MKTPPRAKSPKSASQARKPASPAAFDQYLAALAPQQRAALEKLRRTIRAAAPGAEECISYGLAAFRLDGVLIAGLGAGTDHCAYYPMSGRTVGTLRDDLARYETSKGTIRFPPDKPLPAPLVRKLIKTRLAEAPPSPRTGGEREGAKARRTGGEREGAKPRRKPRRVR